MWARHRARRRLADLAAGPGRRRGALRLHRARIRLDRRRSGSGSDTGLELREAAVAQPRHDRRAVSFQSSI